MAGSSVNAPKRLTMNMKARSKPISDWNCSSDPNQVKTDTLNVSAVKRDAVPLCLRALQTDSSSPAPEAIACRMRSKR